MPRFQTILTGAGTSPTGIIVPPEIVSALGAGKKPPVTVTINDAFTYRSTIGIMGGAAMIRVSAERRQNAGINAGYAIDVVVELDTAERTVEIPADFANALAKDKLAKAAFEKLAPSHRKEHVHAIEDAKKPETRLRRIESAIAKLRDASR